MNNDIKQKFNFEMDRLISMWDKVSWQDKNVYANWLAQTYFYVKHSTRLLALTAAHFPIEKNKLHNRFVNHLNEEKGHEYMAAKDLKELGCDINNYKESAELSAFYQVQYYWIEHINPVAFLGYVLCLEGLAVKRGSHLYELVRKTYGESCATFLKVHATEDIEHLEKALDLFEGLDERETQIALDNMSLSVSLYSNVLLSLGHNGFQYKKSA